MYTVYDINMNQSQTLQKAFNDHFDEFMDDIVSYVSSRHGYSKFEKLLLKCYERQTPSFLFRFGTRTCQVNTLLQIEQGDISIFY